MSRKGRSEERIVYVLRQVEAGKTVAEVYRELEVPPQAFYSWKRCYGGLCLSELRELRQLREVNRKLKTLVADLTLDKHILQQALQLRLKPAARREMARGIRDSYQMSEKRACGLVGITR